MTTIAAAKKGRKISIACDSLTLFENRKEIEGKMTIGGVKILQYQDSYLGFSGAATWGHILDAYLKRSKRTLNLHNPSSIFREMLALHKSLKEEFFLTPQQYPSDLFESSEFIILLINPYGIFEIDWLRNVREYSRFGAIGTGDEYAIGAMEAVYHLEKDSEKIVKAGILAASKFDQKTELPVVSYSIGARGSR